MLIHPIPDGNHHIVARTETVSTKKGVRDGEFQMHLFCGGVYRVPMTGGLFADVHPAPREYLQAQFVPEDITLCRGCATLHLVATLRDQFRRYDDGDAFVPTLWRVRSATELWARVHTKQGLSWRYR